ncbi:MAG: ATP-binding protein [Bacteroidales bacterium]|nr:ATP-binding protein [Bacteroidales bacterium]MDD3152653.1 ATP-binding protein [Bacteroidales bacterium]MDD3914554.1 ATP-binding protein [Bacteroidales bacterium]MDD4634448.1 ATP-binding protein [Bacteroidales bacterium]
MKEIALNILDIANNSIRAKCTLLEIKITESVKDNLLTLAIIDDGCGMDATTLAKVTDPFFSSRTTRHIGLGVPFLKQHAELAGGKFEITSTVGVGTNVFATFVLNHPDRQPLGDVPDVLLMLIASNPEIDFYYSFTTDDDELVFDTREIKKVLEGIPINSPEVLKMLKDMMVL